MGSGDRARHAGEKAEGKSEEATDNLTRTRKG
jgi:hypothetical protein